MSAKNDKVNHNYINNKSCFLYHFLQKSQVFTSYYLSSINEFVVTLHLFHGTVENTTPEKRKMGKLIHVKFDNDSVFQPLLLTEC